MKGFSPASTLPQTSLRPQPGSQVQFLLFLAPVNLSVLPAKGMTLLASGAYDGQRGVALVLGTGQVLSPLFGSSPEFQGETTEGGSMV